MSEYEDKSLSGYDKARLRFRKRTMSSVCEAQKVFRTAFPRKRYAKLEALYQDAVRFVEPLVEKKFTARRARSIYEGTARRIDSDEMDALRAAQIEELRREYRETQDRLEKLDRMLAALPAQKGGDMAR